MRNLAISWCSIGLLAIGGCGAAGGGGGGGGSADGSGDGKVTGDIGAEDSAAVEDGTAAGDGAAAGDSTAGGDGADAAGLEVLGTDGGGDGGGGDTATPGTYATCTEASQCAQDSCKTWSATCGQACANAAAQTAAAPAAALLDCSTKKCLQGKCAGTTPPDATCMDACIGVNCGNELAACWEQGFSAGQKACSTAPDCMKACDSAAKPFTCRAACYQALSKTGAEQFKVYATCAEKAGDANKCVKESLVCLSDAKTGSGTCYDLSACAGKCAKTDSACVGLCYGQGTATAQNQLITLLNCLAGPNASACLDPTIACATPSGSAKCLDTATCVGGCPPSGDAQATCIMDCLHKATPNGAKAFGKLAPCMLKNCPGCTGNACQTCAQQKCLGDAMNCSSN